MYSSVIGKIEKAKRYAEEKGRVTFQSFVVDFKGENDNHRLEYSDGIFKCTCDFFAIRGFCSHTMALQNILEGMLAAPAVQQA